MLVSNDIKVTKAASSRINEIDWDNLVFGKEFSDHMLVMNYKDGAWQTPEIVPFGNLPLHPATSALHYGQTLFEGLKAYRQVNGDVSVFRPNMNAVRFKESCERMCMPVIEEDLFVNTVLKFVEVEKEWVSDRKGYALYLRPFMFATDPYVGIRPSQTYTFVIFACPVGQYYSEPVRVKIEEKYTRAAEGGVGRAKVAGNYGAAMFPAKQGQEQGFHQLLWTDAKTHEYIEESGTMNVMFVQNGKVITPTEESDTILRGITKRSVLEVAQHWGLKTEERKVSVKELVDGIKEGSITEVFGAGTAATIAPIITIGYRDEMLSLAPVNEREFSNKVSDFISDIKIGKTEDIFNWNYKVG